MQDILRRFRADLPVSDAEWEAWQAWRGIGSSASGKKRKRKKRRKKKTLRTSSHLTLRRAHRRQRQWYAHVWFCCFGAFHAVFPSFVGRTQLLGIMDGMDHNDSIPFARRRLRLWQMQCWFYWYCTSRCVPSCFRQASDAPHHGRYGPEGQLCAEMVVNIFVVAQRQFPMGLTVQKTIVIPLAAVLGQGDR